MRTIVILAVMLLLLNPVLAQKKKVKLPAYKIWVYTTEGEKIKGILHEAHPDGIIVDREISRKKEDLFLVEAHHIAYFKFRRKGSVGKGMGIGFTAGVVVGGIGGYATTVDDPSAFIFSSKETGAALGAISLGLLGGGAGAAFGSVKRRVYVNGDPELYATHRNSLVNYDLVPDY